MNQATRKRPTAYYKFTALSYNYSLFISTSSCSSPNLASLLLCYCSCQCPCYHQLPHLFLNPAMLSTKKSLSYLSDSLLMQESCVMLPLRICSSFWSESVQLLMEDTIYDNFSIWLLTGRFIATGCFGLGLNIFYNI